MERPNQALAGVITILWLGCVQFLQARSQTTPANSPPQVDSGPIRVSAYIGFGRSTSLIAGWVALAMSTRQENQPKQK